MWRHQNCGDTSQSRYSAFGTEGLKVEVEEDGEEENDWELESSLITDIEVEISPRQVCHESRR